MLADLFNALLAWIQQNPTWAYLGVFLISAGESLAIVGLFLPGVAIMFGIGALVAAGALELWPTLGWAAAGAVLGDGASFWIGRHFHQRLRVIWPFRRYPALLNRGVDFFHRHGGKSVVLARFLGPVRPILPAVAGMLDMPPRRFFIVNLLSALLWAPAYILPGVVFGASVGLAAEVAGRLAVLVLVLVAVVWFGLWLVGVVYRYLQPRADFALTRMLAWGGQHPLLQPLVAAVLDPEHPEARGLAALIALLALASLALAWLFGGWLTGLDLFLHTALQDLRTPVADRVLVFISALGDSALLFGVLGAGCVWLWLRGRWNAALHWLATGLSVLLLTRLLKFSVAAPRPQALYEGISAYSFPSGHASLSMAVYGFLAVLIARELSLPQRWVPYTGAALLIIPIGFSRLYLGAHWLSDVLAGTGLGLTAVALFGIAYRRHPARPLGWPMLALVSLTTLATLGGWRLQQHFAADLDRYAVPHEVRELDAGHWWSQEWRRLPAYRHDLRDRNRQPLNLYYAGEPARLRAVLGSRGWQTPTPLSLAHALQWLTPQPDITALPVLPQVHDGQHDALRLQYLTPDGRLYLLRLWPTGRQLQPGATALWVGSVTESVLHRQRLFAYRVTGEVDAAVFATLRADLASACATQTQQRDGMPGAVLLVQGCAPTPD
ncbi:MAG: VTT domain-containing protein [Gammaproteobacteria bacterium]